jgi:hypothetical protein
MSLDIEVNECRNCDGPAFEPKPCAECGPGTTLLCSDCRKECRSCGETVCFDHFNDKKGTCDACERKRMIESGEALAEWKQWRDE